MFLLANEKIGIGWSHLCFHGGTKGLVYVCVHKIEGALFKVGLSPSN